MSVLSLDPTQVGSRDFLKDLQNYTVRRAMWELSQSVYMVSAVVFTAFGVFKARRIGIGWQPIGWGYCAILVTSFLIICQLWGKEEYYRQQAVETKELLNRIHEISAEDYRAYLPSGDPFESSINKLIGYCKFLESKLQQDSYIAARCQKMQVYNLADFNAKRPLLERLEQVAHLKCKLAHAMYLLQNPTDERTLDEHFKGTPEVRNRSVADLASLWNHNATDIQRATDAWIEDKNRQVCWTAQVAVDQLFKQNSQ